MALVFVQRYAESALLTAGTQYVEGALVIEGTLNVYLDSSVYTTTGTYVLFDFSAGSFPTPGQVSNIVLNPPAGMTASAPSVSGTKIIFTLS